MSRSFKNMHGKHWFLKLRSPLLSELKAFAQTFEDEVNSAVGFSDFISEEIEFEMTLFLVSKKQLAPSYVSRRCQSNQNVKLIDFMRIVSEKIFMDVQTEYMERKGFGADVYVVKEFVCINQRRRETLMKTIEKNRLAAMAEKERLADYVRNHPDVIVQPTVNNTYVSFKPHADEAPVTFQPNQISLPILGFAFSIPTETFNQQDFEEEEESRAGVVQPPGVFNQQESRAGVVQPPGVFNQQEEESRNHGAGVIEPPRVYARGVIFSINNFNNFNRDYFVLFTLPQQVYYFFVFFSQTVSIEDLKEFGRCAATLGKILTKYQSNSANFVVLQDCFIANFNQHVFFKV